MKKDLFDLAMDAGMTEQEFIDEMGRLYASHLSVFLEENAGRMLIHTVKFIDHDLEITARRVPAKNLSTVN